MAKSPTAAPAPHFDPNAAAAPGSGVFGLPFTREQARVILIPVPFDATTSYGGGTSAGPEALREASAQVDLLDHQFGNIYTRGIHMLETPGKLRKLSKKARKLAEPIIAAGGATDDDGKILSKVDAASEEMNGWVEEQVAKVLAEGKVPGLIGGDHSTPYGAIKACAEYVATLADPGAKRAKGKGKGSAGREAKSGVGLGILHIDAHMDLREAFEGFTFSHASIMYNVLNDIAGVSKLVQVGIRDYCEAERDLANASKDRVSVHYDLDMAEAMMEGKTGGWPALAKAIVAELPDHVYVSFDIDGLEPSLCHHTGTPVPGGLTFAQAAVLLKALADSGKHVVGFDLVEVCPGPNPDEPQWDANVGARVLYKLCGLV